MAMNNPPAAEDAGLLFEWAPPKGEKRLITLFLLGSLFLHAVAFYMFRIIYPPTIAVLPPPARVNLIAGNSEEGQTLLRWIEAEDPALASATLRPPDSRLRALPKLAHVPSYIVQEPKLKDPPPWDLTPAPKHALPPGPVPVDRNVVQPWPKVPTRASFSDELKQLGEPRLIPTQFAASTAETPESVRFRIGVNSIGEVRYCFRISSSGDSALNEQARQWLVRSRFTKTNPSTDTRTLTWGIATVEWGNDVTQAARAATPTTP